MRGAWRPAAAARPVVSQPPALQEPQAAEEPAQLPAVAAAMAMQGNMLSEGEQPAGRALETQQQRQQEQRAQGAAASTQASSSPGAPNDEAHAPAMAGPLAPQVWAARLGELALAAQQTTVRLRRQLEPPPPGFPPGQPRPRRPPVGYTANPVARRVGAPCCA